MCSRGRRPGFARTNQDVYLPAAALLFGRSGAWLCRRDLDGGRGSLTQSILEETSGWKALLDRLLESANSQ